MNELGLLGIWTPGPLELIVILVIAILIFGKRLPEIARGMGKSLSEFKKGIKEAKDTEEELKKDIKDASGIDEINKDDDK